ncbi:hypothetical protein [Thalassospira alkalitolerans]|uniref:hypothetical protein n=1 Tax=Thalassospira alkalitolerans TaxID=1293890 RepID=UPI003AA9D2C1
MSKFRSIDIDIDIHKLVEVERQEFTETPNTVLRRLLNLPPSPILKMQEEPKETGRPWAAEGVSLPHGTQLRMHYNGRLYQGQIVDGEWIIEGRSFASPSGAACGVALTKKGKKPNLNGWNLWEVQRPSESTWTVIGELRPPKKSLEIKNLNLKDLGL